MMMLQEDEKSCFKAVVRESYRFCYSFKRNDYLTLSEMKNNLLSMRNELAKLGVKSKGIAIEDFNSIPEKTGFIAQLTRNKINHFVFLKKKKGDKWLVYDPAYGYLWMRENELKEEMTGRGLLVYQNDNKVKIKKKASPEVLNKSTTLCLGLMALIRCVTGVLFLYSFNNNTYWIYSFASLGVFLLSALFTMWVNSNALKTFVLNKSIPFQNLCFNQTAFEDSVKVVNEELSYENGILNKFTFLVLASVMAFNMNYYIAIYFGVGVLLFLAMRMILNRFIDLKRGRISYEENKMRSDIVKEEMFLSVWNKSNLCLLLSYLPNLLCIVLTCAFLALISFMQNNFSLDYFLSNLVFLVGSILYIIRIDDDFSKKDKVKMLMFKCGPKFDEILEKKEEKWYHNGVGKETKNES